MIFETVRQEGPSAVWAWLQDILVPVSVCLVVVLGNRSRSSRPTHRLVVDHLTSRSVVLLNRLLIMWHCLVWQWLLSLSKSDHIGKPSRSLRTWLPLRLGQLTLLIIPLPLACFDVYLQTPRTIFPSTYIANKSLWFRSEFLLSYVC